MKVKTETFNKVDKTLGVSEFGSTTNFTQKDNVKNYQMNVKKPLQFSNIWYPKDRKLLCFTGWAYKKHGFFGNWTMHVLVVEDLKLFVIKDKA